MFMRKSSQFAQSPLQSMFDFIWFDFTAHHNQAVECHKNSTQHAGSALTFEYWLRWFDIVRLFWGAINAFG